MQDKIVWEFLDLSPYWNKTIDIETPSSVINHMPQWFKQLKGDIKDYFPDGFGLDHTARHCLGLRGLPHVGYTCPLPIDVESHDYNHQPWGGLNFHPFTLYGTKWTRTMPNAPVDQHLHNYEWNLRLLQWPWRIRLPKGWKLLLTDYMLDWSDHWHAFSGVMPCIKKNDYRVKQCSISMDPDFDYFNIEQVVAIKNGSVISKDTCTFTAIALPDTI